VAYIDPALVTSPKGAISDLEIIHDGGEQQNTEGMPDGWKVGWSLAKLKWHGSPTYAMRWNGGTNVNSPLGNPQSRGIATWFVLPMEVGTTVEGLLQASHG
jgi:hypothetical protein